MTSLSNSTIISFFFNLWTTPRSFRPKYGVSLFLCCMSPTSTWCSFRLKIFLENCLIIRRLNIYYTSDVNTERGRHVLFLSMIAVPLFKWTNHLVRLTGKFWNWLNKAIEDCERCRSGDNLTLHCICIGSNSNQPLCKSIQLTKWVSSGAKITRSASKPFFSWPFRSWVWHQWNVHESCYFELFANKSRQTTWRPASWAGDWPISLKWGT